MNQMDRPILPTEIRRIYEGRVFTLQVETIPLPKGGVLKADIIRHPGSVVIIPVTDAGEIVLVRQYRPAIGRWAWELPAGSLKPGEDVDRAAIRECHEETGLVPEQLDKLGAFYPTPGYCDELMNIYRATRLRQPREDEHATQDEDEDIEARAFDLVTVRSMIAAGDIIDLKTVAGVALLRDA
jgi:8-oxo-dGTP pyrophosphatase MutT (NUDIX family)